MLSFGGSQQKKTKQKKTPGRQDWGRVTWEIPGKRCTVPTYLRGTKEKRGGKWKRKKKSPRRVGAIQAVLKNLPVKKKKKAEKSEGETNGGEVSSNFNSPKKKEPVLSKTLNDRKENRQTEREGEARAAAPIWTPS